MVGSAGTRLFSKQEDLSSGSVWVIKEEEEGPASIQQVKRKMTNELKFSV